MLGSVSLGARAPRSSFVLLVILLAALGLGALVKASTASAIACTSGPNQPLAGSCFEGADGDQVDPDGVLLPNTHIDWQTLVQDPLLKPGLKSVIDPSGATDTIHENNDEEQEPGQWDKVTQSVPGKADFLGAWSYSDTTTDDLFLYLAFRRAVDSGDTYYSFELNQSRDTFVTKNGAGSTFPKRTDGDILISYNISPSDEVSFGVCEWQGDTPATSHLSGQWLTLDGDPLPTSKPVCPPLASTQAQGALNSALIPATQNFLGDNPATPAVDGPPLGVRTFAEAAINLSDVLGAANRPCFSFGRVWARSRSSESLSSSLQDFIEPQDILAETCTARGTKFHDLDADGTKDAGEPGLADWRIFADYDGDGRRDTAEVTDSDGDGHIDVAEPSALTGADGSYVISGIEPPATYGYNSATANHDYVLREELPGGGTGGWTCSAPAATFTGGSFPCGHGPIDADDQPNVTGKDFGNYKKGKIVIKKVNVGGTQADAFPFSAVGLTPTSFTLAATSATGQVYENVSPNAGDATVYSVTEGTAAPADLYNLTSIACDDADSTDAGRTATIKVSSNETVTCTFTNTRKMGKLEVVKKLEPITDTGKFDLKIDGVAKATAVGHNGTTGEQPVNTGDHTVAEAGANGTDLDDYVTSLECKDGATVVPSAGGTVAVAENSDIVCTFTNKREAKVTIVKDADPNGAQDFSFTTTLGAAFSLDDDSDDSLSDQQVFSGIAGFGAASVTEGVLSGWTLADITCTEDAGLQKDLTGAGGTATLDVDPGDEITCTFFNKEDAKVTVVKDADPADGTDFDYTGSLGAFKLDEGGAADATPTSSSFTIPGDQVGSRTVAETEKAGWTLADITCNEDVTKDLAGKGGSVTLDVDEGDDITCTFANKKDAKVTVIKDADPADGTDFDYTGSFGAFKLDDGGAADATPTARSFEIDGDNVGDKTVTEAEKAGWTLTDITCNDAAGLEKNLEGTGGTATLDVDPGDEITCTFFNTQDATVEIVKDADPADGTDFDYSGGLGGFLLDHGGAADAVDKSETFTIPAAGLGSIDVTEEVEAGWTLADITCSEDAGLQKDLEGKGGTATISVAAGDQITCTFFNKQDAKVTVIKDAVPDDAQDFSFTTEGLGAGFKLDDDDDGELSDRTTVSIDGDQVGAKSVTESAQAGWDLTDLDCGGDLGWERDGATANLGVDPGEEITCTFENTKRGSVTVTKTEAGGTPAGEWTFQLTGGPDNVDLTQVATSQDATLDFGDLKPGTYTLCEVDMPIDWFSSLEDDPYNGDRTEDAEAGIATVCVEIEVEPGEAESIAVDNTRPETLIIKEGNEVVHDGDTIIYTFNVSNKGNTPLENVSVADPKCDDTPVRDAASDANSDDDALLEPAGTPEATKSEIWRFTCTTVLGEHEDDEENPVVNVATAHAFDLQGNEVTATDDHKTTIIHPGIDVNKELRREGDSEWSDDEAGDDQVAVHVGDTIEYRFTVTNDGDTALTVEFDDPMCDSAPTRSPDANGKLDVAETWIYRCDHVVTAADGDPVTNTVKVTGTDVLGAPKGSVTDSDSESADVLHPDIEILKRVRLLPDGTLAKTAYARVGETVEYQLDVTNGDSDTPIEDVAVSDAVCDAGTLSAPVKAGGDQDELLDDGETWTYKCTRVMQASDGDSVPNTAKVTGHDTLGCPESDAPALAADQCGNVEDTDTAEVFKPSTLVVKEGNVFAYPGDTVTFTFAVTNTGGAPLTDIVVTDDKCAPVSAAPTQKVNDDGDAQLEKVGADGVNPEKWIYSCTKQIPADHAIGDENPIVNTATATGKDPAGKPVSAQDDHSLTVLHPAIDIEKMGPGSATVGDVLDYTLTIKNPGDVSFPAGNVVVTDPKCSQPPVLQGKGSDSSPNAFDPGDTWTYTCSAATTGMTPGTFVNTASVKGTDGNGRSVTDTDDFPTQLNAQQVLPGEVVKGTARLTGPSGCVQKAFNATVRGSRIAKVTFFVDGKKRKAITAKAGQRAFKLKVRPNALGRGVHRVTARVQFVAGSETKTKTLRLSFQRCARQVVRPQFTG